MGFLLSTHYHIPPPDQMFLFCCLHGILSAKKYVHKLCSQLVCANVAGNYHSSQLCNQVCAICLCHQRTVVLILFVHSFLGLSETSSSLHYDIAEQTPKSFFLTGLDFLNPCFYKCHCQIIQISIILKRLTNRCLVLVHISLLPLCS